MANGSNTLTAVTPKLLAEGLRALRQNAVTSRLVNRRYDAMAGEKGSSIDVPVPSAIAAVEVTPANVPPSTSAIAPTSVSIPLNQWYEAPFYLTDQDMLEAMSGTLPMQASEAIKGLINNVDAAILGKFVDFYGYVETLVSNAIVEPFDDIVTGTGSGTTTAAATLRKVLNKQLAPLDDRRVVFDPDAEASALNVRAFQDMSWSGDPSAIISGRLNERLGFTWWMNQNVPIFTGGTWTGALTVTGTAPALGAKTMSILTTATTGRMAWKKGDLFTFSNDSSIDKTYVVTNDPVADTSGGATITINFEPGLRTAVTSGTTTVTLYPKGSASGAAGLQKTENLAFHRDAIALATRPLKAAEEGLGTITMSAVDEISGLALRLEVTREHKRTRWAYDILYGVQTIRRELGCRLAGKA